MTNTIIAQGEPVLVAIDIAKARHEVLIAVPGRKRRRRLTVLNQLDDFNRLITTLSDYHRPVRAAFEATGNYHRALAYRLGIAGFEVKLVSSVALARTREALNNSWDKNDPKDVQVKIHAPFADYICIWPWRYTEDRGYGLIETLEENVEAINALRMAAALIWP